LSDRRTIETFAGVVQSVELMKLLTILTTADIRGVGPGVWNGWKAQLLRTLYYETEPVLTGGFSEVNRARRIAAAQGEFRAAFTEWPEAEVETYIGRHYPAYWLKVELPRKIRHARFLRASEDAGHKLAINVGFDEARGVTELTILAVDHPWLLSIIAGACASAGANIVDAQIYATRIGEMIEQVLEGGLRLPEVVARRAAGRGKARPFVVEPEVTINNQWSELYTVIEMSGLDRPGLLYELTTAISKLNLNIASAHVATFGERARDVFYVTDLLGAQINAPTRQAAIRSALLHLLASDTAMAKPAA
jgi:[protein-PII] uridylyltransferase